MFNIELNHKNKHNGMSAPVYQSLQYCCFHPVQHLFEVLILRKLVYIIGFLVLAVTCSPCSASFFTMPDMDDVSSILNMGDRYSSTSLQDSFNPADVSEQNLKRAISESLHSFVYDEGTGTWSAYNPGQEISLLTNGSGSFCLETGKGSFSLSLSGVGRSGALISPDNGYITIEGRNLDSVHEGFTEWYRNHDEGIEHGMTILSSPSGTGDLMTAFEVTGDLTPSLDGETIFLSGDEGRIFRYGGLTAWDATGRHLKTTLGLSGNTIFWEMDDKNAVYPVTVDPLLTQVAILSASDKSTSAYFGSSVSLSGDYAIVGARYADPGGVSSAGEAYIFKNDGYDTWGEVATLSASNKSTGADFGYSVSLSGDYAIVGARNADPGGVSSAGEAYIFKNDGYDTWGEVATLSASNKSTSADFGSSVSLSGDYAIVGAQYADPGGLSSAGEAYIFKNDGYDTWGEVAILNASNKSAGADFGSSVSLSGDYAIVGAPFADPGGLSGAGEAYIFKNDGYDTWGEVAILSASDKSTGAYFGSSVSLSGDYAIVGAQYADPGGLSGAGEAYIFKNDGYDTWGEVAILNASNKSTGADFGSSVSLSGDYAIVGARNADPGGLSGAGEAYIFKNDGYDTWGEVATLSASNKSTGAIFGGSVSFSGDYAIVGARYADPGGVADAGEAYIFTFSDPVFTSVNPATGINNNNALSVTITGNNYYGTPVVKLKKTGETAITATGVSCTGNTQIDCIFDINGASPGAWDIEITNPDNRDVTGAGAFTIAVPTPVPVPTGVASSGGSGQNTNVGVGASQNLKAGQTSSFSMDKGAVCSVSLTAGNDIKKIMITVKKQGSLPSSVNSTETDVYEYEDVTLYFADNFDLSGGVFKFRVSKSWLSSKGYTEGDIVLKHYNEDTGIWENLPTELIDEDSNYYYYRTETPSFSWFAIAVSEGETIIPEETGDEMSIGASTPVSAASPAATGTVPVQATVTATATATPVTAVTPDMQNSSILPAIFFIILIGLVVVVSARYIKMRNADKYPEWWNKKL